MEGQTVNPENPHHFQRFGARKGTGVYAAIKAGREDERYSARNSHSRNPTPCARVRQATGATTEWMPRPIGRRPCDSGVEHGDDSGKSFLAMSAHARSAGEQYWVFDGRGTMDFQ